MSILASKVNCDEKSPWTLNVDNVKPAIACSSYLKILRFLDFLLKHEFPFQSCLLSPSFALISLPFVAGFLADF